MPIIIDIEQSMGEKLRQLRIQNNLTMEQFGKIFTPPISRSVVANWEANRNFPNIERLIAISNYFNISTDFLLKSNIKKEINKEINYKDRTINLLQLSKEENTYLVALLNTDNGYDNFYLKIINNQVWHILEDCELMTSISIAEMSPNNIQKIIDNIQKQKCFKEHLEVKALFIYSNTSQQLVTEIIFDPHPTTVRKKAIIFDETLPKSQEQEEYPLEFFFEDNLLMNANRNDHYISKKHVLYLPYLTRVLLTQNKRRKSLR